MEEKKLEYDGFIEVTMENMKNVHLVPTADEVVKVLEKCFAKCGEMSCKDCSVYTGNGLRDCMKSVGINALNLIHRLQDENKRLIEELKEEKVWFSELLQTKNELQEQVDELKKRSQEGLTKILDTIIINQFGVDENLTRYVPAKVLIEEVFDLSKKWGAPIIESKDGKKIVWGKFKGEE